MYSKFPSPLWLHSEFGHGTPGGIVPVMPGFSKAQAAVKKVFDLVLMNIKINFQNTYLLILKICFSFGKIKQLTQAWF